ncbi:MAG: hypothetical protein LBL15_07795 [Oscillospiraceae bacterium]|nr:hypothetical protein [Oscillospiraceae bacterium]
MNLYDLTVLDILISCRDKRLRIPGTEDMAREHFSLAHHIKAAVKGTAVSVMPAAPVAGLAAPANVLLGKSI